MLSVLSETQKAVVETMTMRLHVPQALQYLQDAGHEMSRAKYFRQRKKIENMKLERMHYIAKYFPDQHLERIDRCELIEKLMWENYHLCKDQAKKVKILESIANVQPFLSSYYEATKDILESTVGKRQQQDQESHHSYGIPPVDDSDKELEEPIVGFESEEWALDSKFKSKLAAKPVTEEKPIAAAAIVSAAASTTESTKQDDGGGEQEWKQLKCPNCKKSFYNNFTLSAHQCAAR